MSDLQATDFEVFQDGKRQCVQFAEFRAVDSPSTRRPGTSAIATHSPANAEPRVSLGDGTVSGRRLVFIVDDLQMEFDSVVRAREDLAKIVEDGLQPDDQVMIMSARDRRDTPMAFSTDRALLRRQVQMLRWEARWRNELRDPDVRRLRCGNAVLDEDLLEPGFTDYGALGVLASALSELRKYPGRKTVLLLADRIDLPCPEYYWSFYERLRRLSDLAGRSSAVIYGLHTAPFSSGVRMPERRGTAAEVSGPLQVGRVHNEVSDSLRRLAEPTGGFARRSNSVRDLVDAALSDQGSYYMLAYEPPPGTFAGQKLRYRKLKVRVSRKELSVRTRAGFYSVEDDAVLLRH